MPRPISQRYTPDETTRYRLVTGTVGAVWYVTPWLSAIVNRGDPNAGPKFNAAILPDEKLPPPAEDRPPDYGVAGSLLDGKIYARAIAFRTSQAKSPATTPTSTSAAAPATSPRLPPSPAGPRRRPPHHRRRAARAHHR